MIRPGASFRGFWPALTALTVWLAWFGCPAGGLGQTDHLPPGSPPVVMPPGMMPAAPAPAVLDTALAILEFPDPASAPATIHTVQDSVMFGDLFHLILDHAPQSAEPAEVGLVAGENWLLPATSANGGLVDRILGRTAQPQVDLSDLPATGEGIRQVKSIRVYRTGPFQIQAGSFRSPVITVLGRVAGSDETAAIRAPRPTGWSPLAMLGILVLLVLAAWLALLLWERRFRPEDPADRELPAPAWLTASVDLRNLLKGGSLNRGDNRDFLDGLAGIARRFVAGRYLIAAQEMTGREIIAACTDLGHRSTPPGAFARMIDAVDHHRYNPEGSPSPWCREQAVLLYEQMAGVRILPRYSAVSADLRREAEKAWVELGRELSVGTRRRRSSGGVDQGPVT